MNESNQGRLNIPHHTISEFFLWFALLLLCCVRFDSSGLLWCELSSSGEITLLFYSLTKWHMTCVAQNTTCMYLLTSKAMFLSRSQHYCSAKANSIDVYVP